MNDVMSAKVGILSTFAIIGTVLANALGGWDAPLILLLGLMVSDVITGVLIAIFWNTSPKTVSGKLSSAASYRGLCKKFGIIMMVWIAVLMDAAMGVNYLRTAVVLFFSANEGLSLLENLGIMGVKYPPIIRKSLEALQEKVGDTETK